MKKITQAGQTLISLLLISFIGITVATGAAMLIIINSQSELKSQQGEIAYAIAQSGIENAILKLTRDPAYRGESNFAINNGYANIQVTSSSGTLTATSSGKIGNFIRTVELKAHYTSTYDLMIDSRKEIF